MHAATVNKKKAFSALFLIELWERFGYYGMAVPLVLFMKDHLGFSDSRANLTWGAFAAMVYAVGAARWRAAEHRRRNLKTGVRFYSIVASALERALESHEARPDPLQTPLTACTS